MEAAVTDDIDMYVEGNSYSNKTGKDKVWAFRGVLPNAPDGKLLWTNMYDSWHFDPNDANTLYARMTTFLRALQSDGAWELCLKRLRQATCTSWEDGRASSIRQGALHAPTSGVCAVEKQHHVNKRSRLGVRINSTCVVYSLV